MPASVPLAAASAQSDPRLTAATGTAENSSMDPTELAPTSTAALAAASSPAQTAALAAERANQRNALLAGFLGWTLDAFDFFLLVLVLDSVAKDLGRTRPEIALTLTASLAMRPVGAVLFGLMADRYGRRIPLMVNLVFYSVIEVMSGLAPDYTTFLILRLLFGIGMGGEWGVGASLAMESVPARWRGFLSGVLQEGYALGYLLAALAYYTIYPTYGWRVMFFIGGLPALLSLFVRARVKESDAWHEHKLADWSSYRNAVMQNWKLFAYLVLLIAIMAMMSHGTQDMYPTFLKEQRHFSPRETAVITMISMVGAIAGGLTFGWLSDRHGRKRAMVIASLCGLFVIPLWVLAPTTGLIALGAFMIQFMVQGAWGVVPAHLNELSPPALRGFFPGFAYQLGVLCSASITYIEALLGEHFSYAAAMGILAGIVFVLAALIMGAGPEAKGISFRKAAL
jgi:SHS family lactate transporter-like MFS transporter